MRLGAATAVMSLAVGLLTALSAPAQAAAPVPPRFVSGWIPYYASSAGNASLWTNRGVFSDVSAFWYSAKSASTISPGTTTSPASVIQTAHNAGIPAFAAVTDDTPAYAMAGIIADATQRATHVQALVNLSVQAGFDGIDLDYEGFAFRDDAGNPAKPSWATTKANWGTFVGQLAAALHASGKKLSITVPWMTSDTTGYWVYNWPSIGQSADQVRIMAYDFSTSSAGPIAPVNWVDQISAYAVTKIPSRKIWMGVPTYGRDWEVPGTRSGVCPSGTAGPPMNSNGTPKPVGLTATAAAQQAALYSVAPSWNTTYAERTYSYGRAYSGADGSCTMTRTVWYDDGDAVYARALMVPRYGLGGITLWTVGGEDPNQWARLWSMAGLSTSPYDPRVASQTQVEAFVQALYRDLLGRGADAGGLAFWTSELRSGRLSRDSAALGLTG